MKSFQKWVFLLNTGVIHYMYLIFSCSSETFFKSSFTISLAPARSWSWRMYKRMGWQSQQRRITWCKWWSTCMALVHLPLKWQCNTDSQLLQQIHNQWPCCYWWWLQNLFYYIAYPYFVCILSMVALHTKIVNSFEIFHVHFQSRVIIQNTYMRTK